MRSLPFESEETWDDGTHVVNRSLPFPYRRPPAVRSSWVTTAMVGQVSFEHLFASQRTVTEAGLKKYERGIQGQSDLPLVYAESDGTFTIGDGHHRIAAAWLRGEKSFYARVVPPLPLSGVGTGRWMRTPGGRE